MSKSKRVVAPFTNQFGQTLNPGESCIAITTCTGRTSISRVEYVGYIERNSYNYQTRSYEPTKYVQIRRPAKVYKGAFYEGTDEKARWPYDANRKVDYRYEDSKIITTLQYNNVLADKTSVDDLIKAV